MQTGGFEEIWKCLNSYSETVTICVFFLNKWLNFDLQSILYEHVDTFLLTCDQNLLVVKSITLIILEQPAIIQFVDKIPS